MNPLREKTEYLLLRSLMFALRCAPERLTISVFRFFGGLFFLLGTRRRKMALRNLRVAFPDKSPWERFRTAWRSFLNIAEFSGESFLILSGKLTPERILARVDETELEKYRRLAAGAGRGVLYLTGHLGNWELLGAYASVKGFKSHVIARRGSNRLIDEKIVTPLRTRYGNEVFYKENAMMKSVKALKRGEAVSFLIDQKIGPREGVSVSLFGQEVLAVASCALLQMRLNPLVVPVFMVKQSRRKYRLIVGDPVERADDGSPRDEQVRALTQKHQNCIEEAVRAYPDQWFWMHDRFRMDEAQIRRRIKRWYRGT